MNETSASCTHIAALSISGYAVYNLYMTLGAGETADISQPADPSSEKQLNRRTVVRNGLYAAAGATLSKCVPTAAQANSHMPVSAPVDSGLSLAPYVDLCQFHL